MAILHGFWVAETEESYLFIWGETWRRLTEQDGVEKGGLATNPYAMTEAELSEWEEVKKRRSPPSSSKKKTTQSQSEEGAIEIVALPTELSQEKLYPISSGVKPSENSDNLYLYPWEIEGISLNPNEAIAFLQSLPLSNIGPKDSFVGDDLRFWSHIARWSLDLLARNKFLPSLESDSNNSFIPTWQPLIDSATDRGRLYKFAREMPISCRAALPEIQIPLSPKDWQIKTENIPPTIPLESSQELLENFLDKVIDSQVRELTAEISPTNTTSLHAVVRQWLKSLARKSPQSLTANKEREQLATLLNNWKSPLLQSQAGESLYRACFRLNPPLSGSKDWSLHFLLEAIDDPEFLVEARTIWERPVERLAVEGREIDFPQETFLSGLGLASKLFPAMEPSLQTATPDSCSLTPLQAYEFIKAASWRFSDSGLGVILPPSLASRDGGASRLGLSVRAQTPQLKGNQKLGLHSLLDFQWELSLGGQKITKTQFDRLVKQKSPLVEINGEWVELQPIDIQMAKAFLKEGKEKMSLSVEDALRLASGETQAIEKLPVVNFEASGQLEELLNTLTDNSSVEAIATPESFHGELRPYQERGVSWLAFMERWGLGACLADDMGLGKCISRDARVLVNGMLLKAEDIWQTYAAAEEEFDGEGFWARPTLELWVNSIDEETGEMVRAPIERLYRQQVREKLRRVKLRDGSSITITRRHKLLTRDGWKKDLEVGDYVFGGNALGEFLEVRGFVDCRLGEAKRNPTEVYLSSPQRLDPPPAPLIKEGALGTKFNTATVLLTRRPSQNLLDRQVFYCQIEAIEDIEYEGWVYDFQVRKHHNFVANNIICHNTIQLIAFLLHQQEEEVLEAPTLLVCPTSVLGNWEREVKKFGPSLETVVHHGDKRPKGKDFLKAIKGKQLVITSYPLLQRDEKSLLAVEWQGVVLDEAQNIKNPEAKQSQAARKLKGSFKVALTGTPLENRLSELRSILDFLNPGYLGSRQFFQRRFATPIEKYGDTNSLQTLRSLVQPFILRRLKTDKEIIQDLPEKQENTVFCSLAKEQAAVYQKFVKEYMADIESSEGIQRRGKILALLTKLKQLCNHPLLLEAEKNKKKKTKPVLDERASGKLRRLEEMLEELLSEGDRALIFTQFAEWGKLLQPYLEEKLGREVLFLYGATRKNQREEMVDRFQNDPQGPPIMILSIKAGGTGLNLTRANHVFHFDRWWNPAVENQATDRVFRIGQTRNVQVHKFVSKGTLEEKIHDLIESKKELAQQVVGAGEQWLTELNTEELRNLLVLDRQSVIDEDE